MKRFKYVFFALCWLILLIPALGEEIYLAVLPFENISEEPEYEWLSKGIPESLIYALSHIHNIRVVERLQLDKLFEEWSFSVSDAVNPETAVRIGDLTGAGTLLLGSYQVSGKNVLILLRFTDLATGEVMPDHSVRIQGGLEEIFTLYKQLSWEIINRFQVRTTPAERVQLAAEEKITGSFEAYESFSRGLDAYSKTSEANLIIASEHFQKAVEQDREFALAYGYLALVQEILGRVYGKSGRDSAPLFKAMEENLSFAKKYNNGEPRTEKIIARVLNMVGDTISASRAINSSLISKPTDAEAWLIRWQINGSGDPGHPDIRQALAIAPDSFQVHLELADTYSLRNRYPEALYHYTRAYDINPDNLNVNYGFAEVYMVMGDYEKAIASYQEILSLAPGEIQGAVELARLYFRTEKLLEAEELGKSILKTNPSIIPIRSYLALTYFRQGKFKEAEKMFDSFLEYTSNSSFYSDPIQELLQLENKNIYKEKAAELRKKLNDTRLRLRKESKEK